MYDFINPAPGSVVTSKFGYRTILGNKEWHQGVDYAKTGNVPILAAADGVVRQYIGDTTTYGNVIFIQHNINGKQMDTTYAHLKSKLVKNGDKVKQGQVIGYMGNTGRSTGQHLHFEIHNGPWKSGQPNAVDPLKYVDIKKEVEQVNNKPKDTKGHWAEHAIQQAIDKKIMFIAPDGNFYPDKPLTRSEFAALMVALKLI